MCTFNAGSEILLAINNKPLQNCLKDSLKKTLILLGVSGDLKIYYFQISVLCYGLHLAFTWAE